MSPYKSVASWYTSTNLHKVIYLSSSMSWSVGYSSESIISKASLRISWKEISTYNGRKNAGSHTDWSCHGWNFRLFHKETDFRRCLWTIESNLLPRKSHRSSYLKYIYLFYKTYILAYMVYIQNAYSYLTI